MLLNQWKEYRMILDSTSQNATYHVPIQHTNEHGRPKFDIDQEQLEYLVSLSFSWSDIAALLGISRTTLYRYTEIQTCMCVYHIDCYFVKGGGLNLG